MIHLPKYKEFESNDVIKKSINWYLCILIAVTPFTRVLLTTSIAGVEIDFLAYPLYIFMFIRVVTGKMHKYTVGGMAIFLIVNLCTAILLGNSISLVLKVGIPMFFGIVGFVSFLNLDRLKLVFKWYMNFSLLAAYFGFLQFFLKFFGLKLLSNFSAVNLHSLAGEPSHYAIIIVPAVVIAFYYYREEKITFLVLLTSLILTFKLTSIIIIILLTLVIYREKRWILVLLLPLFVFVYNEYLLTNENFSFRILSLINYFRGDKYLVLHGTPLSVISNLLVAMDSLERNWLTGAALGNHEIQYMKTFSEGNFIGVKYQFGLNFKSAHSLTIRILSETGILGFMSFLVIILKNVYISKKKYFFSAVIGLASASHFIGKSIKLGSYIDYGSIFFLSVLLFNLFKLNKSKKK